MKRLQLFLLMLMALPIGMLAAGTTWQTATLIEKGSTGTGSLSASVKEQWHKIVVPENGVIKLTVTPASGLSLNYMTLYSVVSNETKKRNYIYFGGSDQKVLEVKDVAAGTYYILTDRYNGEGSFTIKYSFTATSSSYPNDKEVNDTYDKASEVKLGTNTTGQLGYYYWDDRDTKDYHKIVVPENGTLELTLAPHSNLRINYMTLYALQDGELKQRNYTYFGGNDTKTLKVVDVAPGTYYILIDYYNGQGGYRLTYNFSYQKTLYPNDNEPNDTYDKATELKNGLSTTGQLGYFYWDDRDTEDYHKIVVPENGTIQLTLTPQKDELRINYMTLYALKDGELNQRNYTYFGSSDEKTLEVDDVAPGTYYILINYYNGQGGYTLSYKFLPLSAQYPNDNEPNDTYDKATLVKRGNTITGQLGYYYWDDRDTKDYHKIEVPRNGNIKLTLAPQKDKLRINYMTLYALKDGELKQRNYTYFGSSDEKTLEVDDVAPGTYYILIDRYNGQGGYTLQYIFEQNPYATDVEPNDTYDKALSLAKGNTVAGHLGYYYWDDTDKQDWYKINLASKGSITLTAKPYGTLKFNYITLYASNGTSSKGNVYFGGSDQKQLTVENLDAGTYYVLVDRYNGNGYYFLAYASTIGNVDKQEPLPDEGTITLNKSEAFLEKAKTMTLKATVSPETLADKSVTWKSSNTAVATVTSSGKVKGVKAGTATITCTSVATGAKATCKVTVSYVKLDKSEAILEKGKTMKLTSTVYPSKSTDQSVTWKSSDKTIATVSSSGKVKGVKAGTATITCTSVATGLSTTCKVTVSYVKLDKSEAILEKGETITLTSTVYPSKSTDQSVTWESSDKTVATVSSSGKVKGVKAGTATITCTSVATGLSTTCQVTVNGVSLDMSEAILEKGKTMTLKPSVYPETLADKSVTWKSSNTAVATVTSSGKVKGVKAGTATITCTSVATGAKATCQVTVSYVKLDKSETILEKGKTMTLTSTVYPSKSTDQSVTWKSSNTAVATVTSSGKVKGVKAGTATITCTSVATGLSTTCQVTVSYVKLDQSEAILEKGETITLTSTVYPSKSTDQSVTWESSDKTVATVSSSGKVKGVKAGTAIITCTSVATGLSTTCKVTVTASSNARTLDGDDADMTGIENLNGNPAVKEPFDVYDLRGRKVMQRVTSLDGLPAGVYIVNGKKVLKK